MHEEFVVKRDEITRPPTHPGVFFAADILPALGRRTIGEIRETVRCKSADLASGDGR
jgi:hypothetical protein